VEDKDKEKLYHVRMQRKELNKSSSAAGKESATPDGREQDLGEMPVSGGRFAGKGKLRNMGWTSVG
jgi:hypothetical protein